MTCALFKTCLQQIDSSRRGAVPKFEWNVRSTHTHNCVEKCFYIKMYISIHTVHVLCVYACRGARCHSTVSLALPCAFALYSRLYLDTARSPKHTFPAACPRITIKYLVYKCVRPYPLFFIQYLCNFFAISTRLILFFVALSSVLSYLCVCICV